MKTACLAAAVSAVLTICMGVGLAAPMRVAIDADRDGVITRVEASGHPKLAARFDALDANRDGVIDAGDRPQRVKGKGKGMLAKIDANRDGRITRAEASTHPKLAERFDMFDANRDGALTRDELKRARADRQEATSPR